MNLHSLKPSQGAIKKRKRIARGPGSGHGGTATRGHKGAKSRSGFKSKRHFEGGQMPIQMRLPKRGFKNPNRIEYKPISVSQLDKWADKFGVTVFDEAFYQAHNVYKKTELIKVLADGEPSRAFTVSAHAFSAAAKAAIEAKGGSVQAL